MSNHNVYKLEISPKDNAVDIAEKMLVEPLDQTKKIVSVPFDKLSTLGAGVSELVPAFRQVTTQTIVDGKGLYRLANEGTGDVLKIAKDGNYWGAFKTSTGTSKFAKLSDAGDLIANTTTTVPVDPATMMMAAALYSIEKELGEIKETTESIIRSMEIEKESKVEGNLKTLIECINDYKYNWNNEGFRNARINLINGIHKEANEYVINYQKSIADLLSENSVIVKQADVNNTLNKMQHHFKYYRMALYMPAMSTMEEILLNGSFDEIYIAKKREEITKLDREYRELFSTASLCLENMSNHALDRNVVKVIGDTTRAAGNIIGAIPVINKGKVDEFLVDKGQTIGESAEKMETNATANFKSLANPQTAVFTNTMNELKLIYNNTHHIAFDEDGLYLYS